MTEGVNSAKWAIVCDFDGTAIMGDIADALSLQYLGAERFAAVNAEYERGDITFRALLHRLFEPIAASGPEIDAFVQNSVEFRPGFVRLMQLAADRDIPFMLASGGLDIYITPALELLPTELTARITVRANHAEPAHNGLVISFPYEHAAGSCGTCGSCKGAIVRELQQAGYRVIAIGDGNADRCMATTADVMFARARVREWCDRSQIPYIAFETLDVVADFVEAYSRLRGEEFDDAYTSIA
jgi:2-hydroxy-3-keto-5-methylthiopentenyl-1-phosphate phosphatase